MGWAGCTVYRPRSDLPNFNMIFFSLFQFFSPLYPSVGLYSAKVSRVKYTRALKAVGLREGEEVGSHEVRKQLCLGPCN